MLKAPTRLDRKAGDMNEDVLGDQTRKVNSESDFRAVKDKLAGEIIVSVLFLVLVSAVIERNFEDWLLSTTLSRQ